MDLLLEFPFEPQIQREMQIDVGEDAGNYPTYTKENFQFERKISGWRSKGKLDYRRKEYYSYVTWRDPRRRRKRKG